MDRGIKRFRFWCQKVLPLVYDNSLSYYEVLCKVVEYINQLIATDNEIFATIDDMKNDIEELQAWVQNFNDNVRDIVKEMIDMYVAMVLFELTDDGYFVAYIPESWSELTFYTTGYDVNIPSVPEYGHLAIEY